MKFHPDGTLPENGEVFVFGSNLAGRHGAGAAKVAVNRFGAIYGEGVGWVNQSYAIPTKDKSIQTMSLDFIRPYVTEFIEIATRNPDKEFWMTSIGCGLAGYSPKDIAPMFLSYELENVSFPDTWEPHL